MSLLSLAAGALGSGTVDDVSGTKRFWLPNDDLKDFRGRFFENLR